MSNNYYYTVQVTGGYLCLRQVSSRLGWRLLEQLHTLNHGQTLLNVASVLLDLVGQ